MAQAVKNLPAMQETQLQSLGWEDPLEKGIATHSNISAWRTPWTVEPGLPWFCKKSDTTEQLKLSLLLFLYIHTHIYTNIYVCIYIYKELDLYNTDFFLFQTAN